MSETPINEYSLKMDLTITSLEPKDFGGYLCIAKNALGKAEGSIRLQGMLKNQTFIVHRKLELVRLGKPPNMRLYIQQTMWTGKKKKK